MLENLDEQLAGTLGNIEAAIVEMAPYVWEALILNAFVASVTSAALIVFFLTCVAFILPWLIKKSVKQIRKGDDAEDPGILGITLSVGIAVGGLIAIFQLFDRLMWLGLINPEARAVMELLERLG